jgi:hypothetical protein
MRHGRVPTVERPVQDLHPPFSLRLPSVVAGVGYLIVAMLLGTPRLLQQANLRPDMRRR